MNEEIFFIRCIENQKFPKNDALKHIILKRIMQDFDFENIYTEKEVDNMIKDYLDDFTLIRRELVNFGYMHRDPYKGEYKMIKKELTKQDYERNTLLKKAAKDIENGKKTDS